MFPESAPTFLVPYPIKSVNNGCKKAGCRPSQCYSCHQVEWPPQGEHVGHVGTQYVGHHRGYASQYAQNERFSLGCGEPFGQDANEKEEEGKYGEEGIKSKSRCSRARVIPRVQVCRQPHRAPEVRKCAPCHTVSHLWFAWERRIASSTSWLCKPSSNVAAGSSHFMSSSRTARASASARWTVPIGNGVVGSWGG